MIERYLGKPHEQLKIKPYVQFVLNNTVKKRWTRLISIDSFLKYWSLLTVFFSSLTILSYATATFAYLKLRMHLFISL